MISRAAFCAVIVAGTLTGYAEELTGPPADPKYEYSTPMPPVITLDSQTTTRSEFALTTVEENFTTGLNFVSSNRLVIKFKILLGTIPACWEVG